MNHTDTSPVGQPGRVLATRRGVITAILIGLVLGTALSVVAVRVRPVPTGIESVRVVELSPDGSPGIPWVVELQAERTGYPFLIHLDAAGLPSLLYPDGSPAEIHAGENLRLPDPGGHRAWRSPAGTGGGQLYVALVASPWLAMDRVISKAERAAIDAPDRSTAVQRVDKILRRQIGPGVLVTLPNPPATE